MKILEIYNILLEESKGLNSKEIEEGRIKNLIGAAALTAASLGSPKAQAQEVPSQVQTSISVPQTTAEKRAEVKKRNQERIQKDFEERAKKFGFDTVSDYLAWQESRNKGKDCDAYGGQLRGTDKAKSGCATSEKDRAKKLEKERDR